MTQQKTQKVERFVPRDWINEAGGSAMRPSLVGAYVFYDDYAALEAAHLQTKEELERERESKNTAYSERDRLVCAISKMLPSWLERHPDADVTWENDWRWIVFVTFPTGQASWHIHDSELAWFDHLERRDSNSWDGHSTAEKYARIERFERIGELPDVKEELEVMRRAFETACADLGSHTGDTAQKLMSYYLEEKG